MSNPKFTNRLVQEKSPYLLQHAHNPVDWFSWCDDAFSIAKKKNLPVLVSIGYATCHWCHVMEQESFEDEATAQYMNQHFVCIKVDREERPDVDQVYMQAVHALGQQGGWPLNVFVTPDGVPFYGGTYFPPISRYGMASFRDVLSFLVNLWQNETEKIQKQGDALIQFMRQRTVSGERSQEDGLHFGGAERALKNFENAYDSLNFGFKFQPRNKFPPSMGLSFLLRHHHRTGHEKSLAMVENTLRAMKYGGIYDQIGGGLSRYSTDYRWLVPHFEKMLYDNALFVTALVEAFQVNNQREFADWALDILEYIRRDMTSSEGGFYSAEDADSEGVEGKFYVWTKEEIESILSRQSYSLACEYYNVTQHGNFEGKNILNVTQTLADFSKLKGLPLNSVQTVLDDARSKLLEVRSHRIRPLLDDKILTSWNGLMISAIAKAGRVLENPDLIVRAEQAVAFIFDKLWTSEEKLLRRYRDGEARYDGYLFDYTAMANACLDVYEATYNQNYISWARKLMKGVIQKFASPNGAYYETASDAENLIVRHLTSYDGVEPSGNSGAAMAFLRLGAYDVNPQFIDRARDIMLVFLDDIMEYGLNAPFMMQASHLYLGGLKEVAIVGRRGEASTEEMLNFIRKGFLPQAVIAFAEEKDIVRTHIPLLKDRTMLDGKATAYVCKKGTCQAPVNSIKELLDLIDAEYKVENGNEN